MKEAENVFMNIYQNRLWTNGSGSGSQPENTLTYRTFLEKFIKEKAVTTVLDLGCGDWQSSRLINWNDITYIGVDLVAPVVEENLRRLGKDNVRFVKMDMIYDRLPSADLVIVKDVLQHWPNDTISSFIPLLRAFQYTLITNTLEVYETSATERRRLEIWPNQDISMGGMRPIELAAFPFNLQVKEVFRHLSYRSTSRIEEIKTTVMILK